MVGESIIHQLGEDMTERDYQIDLMISSEAVQNHAAPIGSQLSCPYCKDRFTKQYYKQITCGNPDDVVCNDDLVKYNKEAKITLQEKILNFFQELIQLLKGK